MKKLERLIDELSIPFTFMLSSAILDTVATYKNIHGTGDLYLEGNPLIRTISEHSSLELGLILPKMIACTTALAVAACIEKKEDKRYDPGKLLLYGAGIYWTLGAMSHIYLT